MPCQMLQNGETMIAEVVVHCEFFGNAFIFYKDLDDRLIHLSFPASEWEVVFFFLFPDLRAPWEKWSMKLTGFRLKSDQWNSSSFQIGGEIKF